MEYKKYYKKFYLAFKKEVAMEAIANKRKLEEEKPDDVWNPMFLYWELYWGEGVKIKWMGRSSWVDVHYIFHNLGGVIIKCYRE